MNKVMNPETGKLEFKNLNSTMSHLEFSIVSIMENGMQQTREEYVSSWMIDKRYYRLFGKDYGQYARFFEYSGKQIQMAISRPDDYEPQNLSAPVIVDEAPRKWAYTFYKIDDSSKLKKGLRCIPVKTNWRLLKYEQISKQTNCYYRSRKRFRSDNGN